MEKEYKAYTEFMYNPENSYNCDECPENLELTYEQRNGALPCGQQNCWVDCHCRHYLEEE